MEKFDLTHEVLSSLTRREIAALRKRFFMSDAEDDRADNSSIPLPPGSDDNGGSGGSAPACPLFEYPH